MPNIEIPLYHRSQKREISRQGKHTGIQAEPQNPKSYLKGIAPEHGGPQAMVACARNSYGERPNKLSYKVYELESIEEEEDCAPKMFLYHPSQKLGILHQGQRTSIAPEIKNLDSHLHIQALHQNTVANGTPQCTLDMEQLWSKTQQTLLQDLGS